MERSTSSPISSRTLSVLWLYLDCYCPSEGLLFAVNLAFFEQNLPNFFFLQWILRSRYCYTSHFIEVDVPKMSWKIAAILLPADGSISKELLSLHFLSRSQKQDCTQMLSQVSSLSKLLVSRNSPLEFTLTDFTAGLCPVRWYAFDFAFFIHISFKWLMLFECVRYCHA